jgi:hypothetical protein
MTAVQRYAKFYAQRKALLSKLIEKHSGEKIRSMTHGDAASLYIGMLQSNRDFRADVDSAIEAPGFRNAVPFLSQVVSTVGNVISSGSQTMAEKEKQDTLLYEAILSEQRSSDVGKLALVGGISLIVIITAVIVAVKLKKKG